MKGKKWVITFVAAVICLMGIFMGANYKLDAAGYFSVEHGQDRWGAVSYFKASKIKYLEENGDGYTGFVIGGSKSGTVEPERIAAYEGGKWFNISVNSPTFKEYYLYAKWLTENTGVKSICLYLSGHEVNRSYGDTEKWGDVYKVTKHVTGDKAEILLEKMHFLTLDIESNVNYIRSNADYLDKYYYDAASGGTEYLAYNAAIADEAKAREWIDENIMDEYQSKLGTLFSDSPKAIVSAQENVAELQSIIDLCRDRGIELKVILGPTFLGELSLYESQEFYTYLRALVNETDIFDFSGYNDICMNAYNFVDTNHCNYDVNDLVIDIVYGGRKYAGFGEYLTAENIDAYLQARSEKFRKLRLEYERTGTVALNNSYDERLVASSGVS